MVGTGNGGAPTVIGTSFWNTNREKPRNFQEKKREKTEKTEKKSKKQEKKREKFLKIEKNIWGKNIRDLIFEKKTRNFQEKKEENK